MPRPIRIGAALRCEFNQQRVKALNHADRVGVGLIRLQDGQTTSLRTSRLGNEHASAFAAEIGG
jgi:hypothetical protein